MRALLVSGITCLLLVGCSDVTSPQVPDMTPVGNGLEFLGIAGVLMSLIIVVALFLRK